MKRMKFLLAAMVISLAVSPALVYAGSKPEVSGKLTIWSFTDEVEKLTNLYLKSDAPNVTFDYTTIPTENFVTRFDAALASGRNVPDVVALESAFVRKYVESGQLLDLTDIYEANKDKIMKYPVEIGTYNGRVYALSWQVCPGAVFYRRSLARKYIGTDDPATVQLYFSSLSKMTETAATLKEKSGGNCVTIAGFSELFNPFLYARNSPWVVNGKLVFDPVMEYYIDLSIEFRKNHWEGSAGQWSEGWFAGMQDKHKDWEGRPLEVFAYFLPTWGLHYVLKENAGNTAGDWAMIAGPISYRWGGTWLGVYKNTSNPNAARELIRYLTTDDDILEKYARDSGDLVNNLTAIDRVKLGYSEPFLGGQNHYIHFSEYAKTINGRNIQAADQAIESIFQETIGNYIWNIWEDTRTKEQVIAEFKAQVLAQLGIASQ